MWLDYPGWILISILLPAVLLSGCDLQYKMLYYPSPSLPTEQALAERGLTFWPCPGDDYRGLIRKGQQNNTGGTFIVFHGNGGTALNREFYTRTLGRLGYRVILAEYPEYGGRKGKLGESAFVTDAAETVRLASDEFGGPIFILGESLGCGVAAAVVRNYPAPVTGIVLITPWDSLRSLAKYHFPLLPAWLFLRDSYDNVDNLSSFTGRIAIVGAEQDEIIPIRYAYNLNSSLSRSNVKMWTIRSAGHNNWPMFVDQRWWQEVITFVSNRDKEMF